jgi:aminomethyltransferase
VSRPADLLRTPFDSAYPADLETEWIDVMDYAVPLWVTDPGEEYTAFRSGVGLLEYSMLYRWLVAGPGAAATVNAVFSRDVLGMQAGTIAYGVIVDDNGSMVDDPTVSFYSPEKVLIVGGSPDVGAILREHAVGDATVSEGREKSFVLSVQGPNSRALLQRVTTTDLSNDAFPYYTFREGIEIAGIPCQVNRIGFTAELGFEVVGPIERADELMESLQKAGDGLGVAACGAAALMMCRIEAGMVMAHLEYDETSSPFDCRLGWAVDFDKGSFLGRDALLNRKESAPDRIVTIRVVGEPDGLDGSTVLADGQRVGLVTMAVPSPHLDGATIAMARIAKGHAAVGTELAIAMADSTVAARILSTPVYDPERRRVRS